MAPPIPSLTISQTDGALAAPASEVIPATLAICSSGPINTPTLVGSRTALTALFGTGPGVDACAYALDIGQKARVFCRLNPGVAGVNGRLVLTGGGGTVVGAPAAGGSNTGTAVPTLTGTPIASWALKLRVSTAGPNLAASPKFQYSLDGGLTWSAALTAVAGPVALGTTGLSIAWADGTFVLNDVWTANVALTAQQGTCTAALTGTPNDAYDAILEIVRGGATLAANTATYRLSLDGGLTWGPETAMPVSGVVSPTGTGLTLTFTYTAGTGFVALDRFGWKTVAPGFVLQDLTDAWTAMLASPYDVEHAHVVGAVDATVTTAVGVLATAALTAKKPRWVILEARDQGSAETEAAWIAALQADFSAVVSDRTLVCAGAADILSLVSARIQRRSIGQLVAARAALVPLSEDLAWVDRGALPGVTRLYHDEDAVPGLNATRFTTARQHQGRTGFYLTNPVTMAEAGSDFELLQYRRVWDRAYRVLRFAMLPSLSSSLLVNPATVASPLVPGAIDEVDAGILEDTGREALSEALVKTSPQHATAVSVTVDRSNNILTTREVRVAWGITPLGYAKTLTGTLGFINPARVAT